MGLDFHWFLLNFIPISKSFILHIRFCCSPVYLSSFIIPPPLSSSSSYLLVPHSFSFRIGDREFSVIAPSFIINCLQTSDPLLVSLFWMLLKHQPLFYCLSSRIKKKACLLLASVIFLFFCLLSLVSGLISFSCAK